MMSHIKLVEVADRRIYMKDLLLADESEKVIEDYINEGDLYAIHYNQDQVGICLFIYPEETTVEIKNMAIQEAYRGKGLGTQVIQTASQLFCSKGYTDMIVGTSNSSIANLAFYQKSGFRFHKIYKDFFLRYPDPFYENGIRGIDMVVLHKALLP
ncbi:GNAT family N-acetyltransferase [Halobacillus karajensis]|uniref:GNAT family N-acetyltransferase n=1 Tax=Halobacillus karajensis TaxID=195088 RepID=UPI001FC994E0|nr:GNAT family N-acetyltransferase [Halobacillus karajensis]